jgi:TRAP-type C4-dicarboxylate transport system substrate-binding protein
LRANIIGDSAEDEEEKHTMNTDHNYPSDVNSDNAITLDDLSEDDRQKIERELKEWEAEFLKRYFKTSNGLVKKVTTPSPSPVFDTQLSTLTHLLKNSLVELMN